jgi:hypothetical protein
MRAVGGIGDETAAAEAPSTATRSGYADAIRQPSRTPITERHLRSVERLPFRSWKLAGQGAVGSQALSASRESRRCDSTTISPGPSRVWPLETGFSADPIPDSGPFVVHAEIWPAVLEPDVDSHHIADTRQILALCAVGRSGSTRMASHR